MRQLTDKPGRGTSDTPHRSAAGVLPFHLAGRKPEWIASARAARAGFGVDRPLPPATVSFVNDKGFLNAKPGVFAPALIEEVDAPVRERSPHQSGKRIDDAAELVLHSRSFQDSRRDKKMNHSMGERPSYLGVGLRRDGGDSERISARSMTFCSSRMFPATRTAEVGSRRRPSRAFVDMLLEVQDGDALHEGFARCPRR